MNKKQGVNKLNYWQLKSKCDKALAELKKKNAVKLYLPNLSYYNWD